LVAAGRAGGVAYAVGVIAVNIGVAVIIDIVGTTGLRRRWCAAVIRAVTLVFAGITGLVAAIGAAAAVNSTVGLVLGAFTGPVAAAISKFRR
jgi:hypothetical protein